MDLNDIFTESAKLAWGKSGEKVVRKYRCTSGKRKGKIVSSPEKCATPIDIKKKIKTKQQMTKFGKQYARKTKKTKLVNPISKQVRRKNLMMSAFINEGQLEKFDFSPVKVFADYAKIPESIAEQHVKKMQLNDYSAFITALDVEDESTISKIVDKYISNQLSESTTFPNISISEACDIHLLREYEIIDHSIEKYNLSEDYRKAYDVVQKLQESELTDYLSFWTMNETVEYKSLLDSAMVKHVYENVINPQLKNNIARLANKPANQVKTPTYDTQKPNLPNQPDAQKNIVQADPVNKTIATQDDKGNVEIHKVDGMNKDKIKLEDLQVLAGIKQK